MSVTITWTRTSPSTGLGGLLSLLLGVLVSPTLCLEIGPEADLCAAIARAQPGEEIVLESGDYRAGCVIRRGGLAESPLVIRTANPDRPPRLTRQGPAVNMPEIRASDIVIRGLGFGPTVADADGVRIISGNRITVEDCQFTQMGRIAVVANHSSLRGLTVRRNVIANSNATGMYFGCHDGSTCIITGLLVEGNYIHGVRAPHPQIGYGLQVKLGSAGMIRDNVIIDIKGPGIMVYGARDLVTVSVVERNFVRGSHTSSGIVVGGGPAVIRNNISGWNFEAGIGLENYGRRGLLRGITVVHNTLYNNGRCGIMAADEGPIEANILNNAAQAGRGAPPLPSPRTGLWEAGNLDCTWAPCFANPDGMDFCPFPGSLLLAPGADRASDAVPSDDYFGSTRRAPPTIGAVEQPVGPFGSGEEVTTGVPRKVARLGRAFWRPYREYVRAISRAPLGIREKARVLSRQEAGTVDVG